MRHSDREILHASVRETNLSMLVFMLNEKKVQFNGEELMLIAVENMDHSLVHYLCNEIYITPSKIAVSKAFYRIQALIDEFHDSKGNWSSVVSATEIRMSLKTLLRCHCFDLGLEDDDRWFPTSAMLKKISALKRVAK